MNNDYLASEPQLNTFDHCNSAVINKKDNLNKTKSIVHDAASILELVDDEYCLLEQ